MNRPHLKLQGIALLILTAGGYVIAASDNKKLVYEGRSVSEWVDRALSAEPRSMALRDACIALVNMDEVAVLSQVLEALKAAEASRRLRALGLICSLPTQSKAAVPPLIASLKDNDDEVRSYAAFALGKFGPKAQIAVQPLTKALKDKEEGVRVNAASALACIDRHRTKEMLAYLMKVMKEGNSRSRTFVVNALRNIASKEALAALSEALADDDKAVRVAAASALQGFGRKAEPVVPALIRALSDTVAEVRQEAAGALGEVGPGAKTAVRPLVNALKDKDWEVRWTAAGALGAIGTAARSAERPLTAALEDDNPIVRVHAACALARINPELTDAMVPRLVRALQNDNASVRVSAIGGLTALGVKAKEAVQPLIEALQDSDPLVRKTAGFALQVIDPQAARRAGVRD